MKEEEVLSELLKAVAHVNGVTVDDVTSREKDGAVCFARGIFCYLGRKMKIHPIKIAKTLKRTRSSCITTAKRYKGYVDSGDKVIIGLLYRIERELKNE